MLSVRFQPVLRPERGEIDTFSCVPVVLGPNGEVQETRNVLAHRGDIEDTAKRNAAVLREAFRHLTAARDRGEKLRLMVPVNSVSLASTRGATELVATFKELDAALRRAVLVEVFNFPSALTLDMLDEITIPLMTFFDRLAACPDEDMQDFTVFSNCNYFGVSVDLGNKEISEVEVQTRLRLFWAATQKVRLHMFIHGMKQPEFLDIAKKYEVYGVDGAFMGEALEAPRPVTVAAELR